MDVAARHQQSRTRRPAPQWPRLPGIVVGIGTQLLFGFTVWHLFFFLRDGRVSTGGAGPRAVSLAVDVLLALQFAVPHSVILHPVVRRRLGWWIPEAFYGCVFCIVTCATLLVTIDFWIPVAPVVYEARGLAAVVIQCGFCGSWIALFYSLHLSGLGYQTGWTPWWHWLRRRAQPKREFRERGAYRQFRHPIYLSFLGLIWLAPRMTLDHAVLTAVWTVYIFVGSYLKDERLAHYLGPRYRDYQQRVPGYPLLAWGPLGRRRPSPERDSAARTAGREDALPSRKAA